MREQQAFTHTQSQRPASYNQRNNRNYPPPANPHKAGHYSGLHPDDAPYQSSELDDVEENDSFYERRSHTSAKRYDNQGAPTRQRQPQFNLHQDQVQPMPIPRRATQTQMKPQPQTDRVPAVKPGRGFRAHPLLYLGIGMIVMFFLWVGGSSFVAWVGFEHDNIVYGTPRTYQFDAVVGHSDSPQNPTHFIVINLNRHIEIVEFPGGDVSHARVYVGPILFGDGQNLTPVTAKVEDVNGDGKPDLIVSFLDQQVIFINDGTQFRPLKPGEHYTLPQ